MVIYFVSLIKPKQIRQVISQSSILYYRPTSDHKHELLYLHMDHRNKHGDDIGEALGLYQKLCHDPTCSAYPCEGGTSIIEVTTFVSISYVPYAGNWTLILIIIG